MEPHKSTAANAVSAVSIPLDVILGISNDVAGMKATVEKLDHELMGNGKPGHIENLRVKIEEVEEETRASIKSLEARTEALSRKIDKLLIWRRYVIQGIIVAYLVLEKIAPIVWNGLMKGHSK